MDERTEGRRPQPTGWSSSPVTPPPAKAAAPKVEATEQAAPPAEDKPSESWTTQSIFSALKRTPGLHPAADDAKASAGAGAEAGSQETPRSETPRKVSPAATHGVATAPRPEASSAKDRVALTLRVDQDRHTRLRVLAAQTKRSSQDILLAALDNYIDSASQGMSFCECLKPSSMCCKSS
jgi:hypothetical protein